MRNHPFFCGFTLRQCRHTTRFYWWKGRGIQRHCRKTTLHIFRDFQPEKNLAGVPFLISWKPKTRHTQKMFRIKRKNTLVAQTIFFWWFFMESAGFEFAVIDKGGGVVRKWKWMWFKCHSNFQERIFRWGEKPDLRPPEKKGPFFEPNIYFLKGTPGPGNPNLGDAGGYPLLNLTKKIYWGCSHDLLNIKLRGVGNLRAWNVT